MPERENPAVKLKRIASQYPREVEIDGDVIQLRLMEDGDTQAILDFARTSFRSIFRPSSNSAPWRSHCHIWVREISAVAASSMRL